MVEGYKNIALPEEMVEAIQKFIDRRRMLGFKTVPEFVKDCVRRRIEEYLERGLWIE
ncbi:MAG: hypothetical protein HWN68_15505 [Desulfobacterales bacterium]|nr:hypothetical protein [Desulfobacterales bacterium]